MPAYLLDTDILIDFLRGRESALQLMERIQLEGEIPRISTVSLAELIAGMKAGEEAATERLLGVLPKIPVTDTVAHAAGKLLRIYQRSHGVELGDALIAATAFTVRATLVTRNVKHYPMPEVNVLRPY